MLQRALIFIAATLAIAAPADAQRRTRPGAAAAVVNTNCPGFYHGGQAPVLVSPPPTTGARHITGGQIFCHSFYSISYSTTLRDPIWTSYRLTRTMVEGADDIGRLRGKKFTLQVGLHRSLQGHQKDYLHPPYDRGHMVPANDAEDVPSQRDTFVITNAVPQTIELNQKTWRYLEASVHRIGKDDGEVFVVTGPIFSGTPRLMHKPGRPDRIAIPSHTYKAIYIPSRDIAVGYIATNDEVAPVCKIVAIDELTRQTGIDPFPALSSSTKAAVPAFTLPQGENVDMPNCAPSCC